MLALALFQAVVVLCLGASVSAAATQQTFITAANRTQPLTLAYTPKCGVKDSFNFTQVNTGITPMNATKTIVALGDSWTSNGSNGTIPFAPVVFPPNPSAGARLGNNGRARASNGYTWVEDLANTVGAKLINYAVGGAVIDLKAWNSTNKGPTFTSDNLLRVDLVEQVALLQQQGHFMSDLDPDHTLYAIAFGINDWAQFSLSGGDWTLAADSMLNQIGLLQSLGAKNILIHYVYFTEPQVTTLQNTVHAGLQKARAENGTNFVSVDLYPLFQAINATPSAFGYTNTTCLASQNTTAGGCEDPDHSVFYIPGHPSATTHELINQVTLEVIEKC